MNIKNKTKKLLIITAIIILFFAAGTMIFYRLSFNKQIAKIYQNNQLIYEIDLSKVSEPYEIEIKGEGGEHNIVLVEKDAISMKSANCPDLTCVKTGKSKGSHLPILCSPNHILIVVNNDKMTEEGAYDA